MTRLKRKKELPSTHGNDVRFGTPAMVAAYRAQRIAQLKPDTIIEAGAGAGFQTLELAKVARHVIAIEIDKDRLGRATLPANVTAIAGDALDPAVVERVRKLAAGKVAVFLDPERPAAAAQRDLADIRPDIVSFIKTYSTITDDIAIELPPFLSQIPFDCEREYLSVDGKLNRLTVYFGGLRHAERSVVQLPSGARIEHEGTAPQQQPSPVQPRYVLEPDAALMQSGLCQSIIGAPHAVDRLGKRSIYLTEKPVDSAFFSSYKIIAVGERAIERLLPSANCATVIVHGAIDQQAQKALLRRLNKLCRGKERLHLFLGKQWYLTRRASTREL